MKFYTDGACSSKDKVGGYACLIFEEDNDTQYKLRAGYENNTTNNRMELLGVLSALTFIDAIHETVDEHEIYTIYTDSAYVANCFLQNWYKSWERNGWQNAAKEQVKNKDLWQPLINLYLKLMQACNINFVLVKGHSSNKFNNLADKYAVECRINKKNYCGSEIYKVKE